MEPVVQELPMKQNASLFGPRHDGVYMKGKAKQIEIIEAVHGPFGKQSRPCEGDLRSNMLLAIGGNWEQLLS